MRRCSYNGYVVTIRLFRLWQRSYWISLAAFVWVYTSGDGWRPPASACIDIGSNSRFALLELTPGPGDHQLSRRFTIQRIRTGVDVAIQWCNHWHTTIDNSIFKDGVSGNRYVIGTDDNDNRDVAGDDDGDSDSDESDYNTRDRDTG